MMQAQLPRSVVDQIKSWFEIAMPSPTLQNAHTQIGVHLEEVAEMLQALSSAGSTSRMKERMVFATDVVDYVQRTIKQGDKSALLDLDQVSREELLDSLCDQIVTAVGVAHMLRLDISGGLKAVADSNDSKFVDGKPIFDSQMKIKKGPDYQAPDLRPFV